MVRLARLLSTPLVGLMALVLLASVGGYSSRDLPQGSSTLFAGSGLCAICHSPGKNGLTDLMGNDVSPPSDWRATLMANAATDPLWRAKVSTEVAANPALQAIIEDKCTTCHAPMGRTEAIYNGADGYSVEEMAQDPLALDGISCTTCHQIKNVGLGSDSSYSGEFVIDDDRDIYGPYENPFSAPMLAATGYQPVFSEHMGESEFCGTCHTLFTPFVDNEGQVAGELPEQTAYLEWKNSVYAREDMSCQSCHMPVLEEPLAITSIPPNSPGRAPFWQHHFVGGNVTMLRLMRANVDLTGATAEEVHFDSTIARTFRLLRQSTVELEADYSFVNDSLEIRVSLRNLAGHKFPTGFPSRRAWLHVVVSDGGDETVFESGRWSADGRIGSEDRVEPHYRLITSPDQVQIYQSVMADVDGEVTWTLLRGASYVKDNRIPPAGFTSDHPDYHHTAVVGAAADDLNFNFDGSEEGSGGDVVLYRIGGIPPGSEFAATIELVYQSIAPAFMDDLLGYETPEVDVLTGLWQDSDPSPVLVKSVEITSSSTTTSEETAPTILALDPVFPNPFSERTHLFFRLPKTSEVTVSVIDVRGRIVRRLRSELRSAGSYSEVWDGRDEYGRPLPAGVYFIRLKTTTGSRIVAATKL